MIIDSEWLKVDENGDITFPYSLWKLPTIEGAFDGILEGKPTKEREIEILNDIYAKREDWLQYGPKPEAWDQFTEVTQIVGRRMRVQIWSAIMFMLEDEGPYPFDALCVGVNLSVNQDGYLQSYMCFKDVSYPDAYEGFEGNPLLSEAPEGTFVLNLGNIYTISILKPEVISQ